MHCIIRDGRPNKAQKSTKSEGSQTLIEECGPPTLKDKEGPATEHPQPQHLMPAGLLDCSFFFSL